MSFEDREFTRQQVIRSLRLCADDADCKNCDFFEAECPRGYNPCHEYKMMELAADYIEERTAKVVEHDASVTDTDGYIYHRSEYLCGACKKKVIGGDEYCSHCGCRLDWNEDIPMEYFESGGR